MSNRAETSRRNGAKSNGPVSPEGRAVSAQNSLKHGFTSSRIVLPTESQEEYDAFEADFRKTFQPEGALETELVVEMAASRWRLRRIPDMESALFKKTLREQQELLGPDAEPAEVRDAAYLAVAESKIARMLVRHGGQLRRAYEKAWKELVILQKARKEQQEQNEPGFELTEAMLDILTSPALPPEAGDRALRQLFGAPDTSYRAAGAANLAP